MTELTKIALVKNHLSAVDHLKRMKHNEEKMKRPQWEMRVMAIDNVLSYYNTIDIIQSS